MFTIGKKGEYIVTSSHPDIRYEVHPVGVSREFHFHYKKPKYLLVIILLKCCVQLRVPNSKRTQKT